MTQATETWSFDTSRIGRRVLVFDQLASTNTTAADLAAQSASDGVVVIANHQTSGRGQYGRVWQSRPGNSLLMSVVLNSPPELRRPVVLTAFAAVAVAEAIFTLTSLQTRIKWPNDLLIHHKKVCGILIEQHGPSAIIGMGLNLNQTAEDFASSALPDATSLAIESGRQFELRTVTGIVLRQLDQEYERLLDSDRSAIESKWKYRTGLIGQEVAIELMDSSILSGRLLEMDFEKVALAFSDGVVQAVTPETVRHIAVL
jgi:BirA family biotin operon repressor/biotin-[acetyl-CoA-carboxylase] ligase